MCPGGTFKVIFVFEITLETTAEIDTGAVVGASDHLLTDLVVPSRREGSSSTAYLEALRLPMIGLDYHIICFGTSTH